jgi:hypothetical protein
MSIIISNYIPDIPFYRPRRNAPGIAFGEIQRRNNDSGINDNSNHSVDRSGGIEIVISFVVLNIRLQVIKSNTLY